MREEDAAVALHLADASNEGLILSQHHPASLPAARARSGSVGAADDGDETVRSRSLSVRSTASAPSRRARTVLSAIDDELQQLRQRLQEHQDRRQGLLLELEVARRREREAEEARSRTKRQRMLRVRSAVKRVQARVRGWLARRRAAEAFRLAAAEAAEATLLRPRLQVQLLDLKRSVHELHYIKEDRVKAAVQVQSWWRGHLMRRVVTVLRAVSYMQALHTELVAKATAIQAWWRSRCVYKEMGGQVVAKILLARRLRQLRRQNPDAQFLIVQLQFAVRKFLKRKQRLQKEFLRTVQGAIFVSESVKAEVAARKAEADNVDGWPQLARRGHEFDRLEEVGLTPFRWMPTATLTRHRIGGPEALDMQHTLGLGVGALSPSFVYNGGRDYEEDVDAGPLTSPQAAVEEFAMSTRLPQNPVAPLGKVWDLYPKGFSEGFLERISGADAPWVCHYGQRWPDGVARRGGNCGAESRRSRKPSHSRRHCRIVMHLPFHAQQRAQEREEARLVAEAAAALEYASADARGDACPDPHPLLENVPALKPAPPPGPPPARLQTRLRAARYGRSCDAPGADSDEDGSWATARDFYGRGRRPQAEDPNCQLMAVS